MGKMNLMMEGLAATGTMLVALPVTAQYSPNAVYDQGLIGRSAQETKTQYMPHNPKAPKGAPNVVWILLDDTGYGVSSAFGGLVETPTFDYLAANGLRFSNFHTASISAATRAALLTGRNHHSSHMGRFNDDHYGAPGYDTYLPMENGTVAEVLRENGYATFAVGKYNATPHDDGSLAGPFNRWPTGRGFDHFYGYHPAAGSQGQWHPLLYRDTHREPDDSLGQLAITRLANEAINYIADQQTAAPNQPFFLYFAPGTAHTPFHTTKEWIGKYKGKFDTGWDDYARRTLENQIRLGVVPKGTKLPVLNRDAQRWNELSVDERRLYAHQMEVFAGFMSQADYEIGRIIEFIREIGQLDNTLVVIALGDNGASGEGGRTGGRFNNEPEKEKAYIDKWLKNLDRLGDETTSPFYANGWAVACNTPFRYYKKWADYEGGTHDGLIVYYPKGIKEKGGVRTQYTHVSDILPTTLELTGTQLPKKINGYEQSPIEGTSFAYAIVSPDNNIETRKKLQYYELNSSYALYKDGWKVQFPNGMVNNLRGAYPDTIPHLYHLTSDFNESTDLADKYPEKVKELLEAFDSEARKHNIYPLKSGKRDKTDKAYHSRSHFDIYTGARRHGEYPYFEGSNGKSFTLSAYIESTDGKDNGILFSQKGFAFYLLDGVPVFATGKKRIESTTAIPTGKSVVKANVNHQGLQSVITLYIDDKAVATASLPGKLSLQDKSDALQVGRQWGVPINSDYQSPFIFTGKLFKGSVDLH